MIDVEPTIGQRVWWQLKRGWLFGAIGLLSLGGAITFGSGEHASRASATTVEAHIIGFAPEDAPKFGKGIIVTAAAGRLRGEADVELDRLFGCRVGDTIPAERRGPALVLRPRPCRH